MFTPQKKLWSLTPRTEPGPKKGSISGLGSGSNPNTISPRNGETSAKDKAVALIEGDVNMDNESLVERVSKLENELFEYQYNMGLLLIEKKDWTVKYEELRQDLVEATDTLKREQTAHSSAMSEVEKREENLKKALGVERQCVLDLEKALHEMRSEYAEIKFNADSKLAEANALVASVDEKSLEVEAKFHSADAKLAEVSRKNSEIERKLHELEAQENALRRERSLFAAEHETHDTAISKQREDLREWERKLQEAEERLADGRRWLNQREEKANENDKILKEKQSELEELRKKVEFANSTLKNKEEDISSRLASASRKEKEADDARKKLEEREKQLLELEEKLNTREKLEIEKLLDEHKNTLAEKEKEFELDMEQKRKLHDEQMQNKGVELEKKEAEITHMEEKVKKREQAIEKKFEKLREKEVGFDSKSKSLKEREKTLMVEEKNFEKDRKLMLAEKEDLLNAKAELENLKTDNEKLQLRLNEEKEQLKVTEEERKELSRLQSELKQEIDKYRFQSEQLMKEADGLKQEKEKFEKEWEELDDKRAEIKKEQEDVLEKKRHLEKLQQSEEERLQNEKLETQKYVQRELDALKLAKDSFADSMEHEKSMLAEKFQSEKTQLINDFEMRKQELETEMQRKQEEIESRLHEREKSFEQEKEMELNNINYLRGVARREMEDMKLERNRIEKEKLELSQNKKHVEAQQCEMKKDIEELVGLSQKSKEQREQFIKERECFIAFAEKQKNCDVCGETIRDFMLSDLHPLTELKTLDAPPLPRVAENYLKEAAEGSAEKIASGLSPVLVNSGSPSAGGTISWLRKCTSKVFKFSPGKKLNFDNARGATGAMTLPEKQVVDSPETLPSGEMDPQPSVQVAKDSLDVEIVESDSAAREVDTAQAISVDQDPVNIPESSRNSDRKAVCHGPIRRGRAGASRTRYGKAVITGSETNGNVENSVNTNDESQAESDLIGTAKNRRKRNRLHESPVAVSDNQTEGHSDSIKEGDRPKRRQRVATAEKNFVQKRYNLRQSKKSAGTTANGSLPKTRKVKGKETGQLLGLEPNQSENLEIGGASMEEIEGTEAADALHRRSVDGDGDDPLQSTGFAGEFSADSPLKNAGGAHSGHVDRANTSLDDVVLSEEVNGMAEGARDYSGEECKTESHGEEEDGNDEDEDEVNHPGEASIGKKLWTFLTT